MWLERKDLLGNQVVIAWRVLRSSNVGCSPPVPEALGETDCELEDLYLLNQ